MSEPLFRLAGIRFGYGPDRPVLSDAGFELFPGERVALTGPNGAGKTTLLHLMLGLQRPAAGSVVAFGAECRCERDFRPVRARAGLLFQDSDDQLFCPTVAEDVAFGPRNLGKSRVEAARITTDTLALLGLVGFERRITYQLSGGEKRLVALATVLAMNPEVLLLDEPATGLDEPTEARLIQILLTLPQAMIIISHDRDFLSSLATRQLELRAGRLNEKGMK